MPLRPRILVIGAGPAGLSAGVHLLEEAGSEVDVEIVTMGHHLGGKAASWRDPDGYSIDHGFHAVFGFYEAMRALARRAGVDLGRALVSSRGESRYWSEAHGLQELHLSRSGLLTLARLDSLGWLTRQEEKEVVQAFARIGRTLARTPSLEALDDVCFKAFLLEHGAPARFLEHPIYRQVEQLIFNHPYEVSTYIVLRGVELLTHCYDDASFSYVAGGLSELFWDPIARYFEKLGGTVRIRQKLVDLEHDQGKLVALKFGIPDNDRFHQHGKLDWPKEVPIAEGTEFREDRFAAVICTLPAACFTELDPGGALWNEPFFAHIRNLTSVSTLSLQAWLDKPTADRGEGTVVGLPFPLAYAVDFKRMVPEFRADRRYGAALEWVGAETGYESVPDDALVRSALSSLARVPGYAGVDASAVVHRKLRRNRSNYQRYLLTDPGTLRFRPTVETPLRGLYLAGDWVRNEVDIPTMEGAIRCGKAAAQRALAHL